MTLKLTGTFVGFCGAGGTGKTTTAQAVIKKLPAYDLLTGVSRSVFQELGVTSENEQYNMTGAERWRLQKAIQIKHHEVYYQKQGQRIISDRTQFDQFAYALQRCSSELKFSDIAWLSHYAESSAQFFRLIFYFPLHTFGSTAGDGMRTNYEGDRLQFDCILTGLLHKYNVPYHEVPIESVDGRAELIMNRLIRAGLVN